MPVSSRCHPRRCKSSRPTKTLTFTRQDGIWLSTPDINATLEPLTDANGALIAWRYRTGADTVEIYDSATGKLLSITTRAGLTQILRYDALERLTSVTDPFGRTLTFAYDTSARVSSVTDPAGGTYSYTYDADNLSSITGPDGTARRYLYEHASFPHALTGLIDENGVRFTTLTYNSQGLAVSSARVGGVDKVSVNYDFANGMTSVTDALGRTRSYTYMKLFGVARTSRAEKPSASGGTATSSWSYDAQGNITTYVDYAGHRTDFTYDLTRNLENHRTEGAGTPLQRTITTEWHPTFRLPTQITEPNRVLSFAYDPIANLIQHTVTAGSESRTWSFQYANGQLTQIDGPRTDLSDLTQYAYDDQGNLSSRTDALGHTTQITAYDAHGRPLTIVDPNGLVTTLEYELRGRVVSRQVGNEVTTYTYDDVGQLFQLTRPDGSFVRFTYDPAHRLTAITDHLASDWPATGRNPRDAVG